MATMRLVLCSPRTCSDSSSARNRMTRHATDAGKATEPSANSLLTPKHARRMRIMPKGTYNHDCMMFFRECRIAYIRMVS